MSVENDYLLRNIKELAAALMVQMGFREGEENLEDIEIDAESHLGMPIGMLETMTHGGLMSFVTMKGGHDPRRMMLLGLVLAARSEQASEADDEARAADVRPKAIALLRTAFSLEAILRTPDTETVLQTLVEDEEEED